MVQKVMVVDEDGRKTEEEYAAAHMLPLESVQNRFAATGLIKCKSFEGTAQLTGSSDIITTVAHMLYEDNCKKVASPEDCTFKVKRGDQEEVRKMSLVGTGFKCDREKPTPADDWAIFKLESKIDNIDYYKIPERGEEIRSNDKIISVSDGAADFIRKNKKGTISNPKSIEDCSSQKVYRQGGVPVYFESDCDSSFRSSGGSALVRRNGADVLVGIQKGYIGPTIEKEKNAIKTQTLNSGSYVQSKWTTFFVPLDGNFLATLRSVLPDRSL